MNDILQIAVGNLVSPMILFFALGVLSSWLKSDLAIPDAISKALSLYLMLAIGFKGGVELAASGAADTVAVSLIVALALSFGLPVLRLCIAPRAHPP